MTLSVEDLPQNFFITDSSVNLEYLENETWRNCFKHI